MESSLHKSVGASIDTSITQVPGRIPILFRAQRDAMITGTGLWYRGAIECPAGSSAFGGD